MEGKLHKLEKNPKCGEIANFYPIFLYICVWSCDCVERKCPSFGFASFISCQWPIDRSLGHAHFLVYGILVVSMSDLV